MDEENKVPAPQPNFETTPVSNPVTDNAGVSSTGNDGVTTTATPSTTSPMEPNVPAATAPPDIAPAPVANQPKHSGKGPYFALGLFLVLGLLVAAAAGSYIYGKNKGNAESKVASDKIIAALADKELKVPQGATVIAQCAKGRGTQYVLPQDIPLGPVYNVYQGKVIGIEFMVGKDDLIGSAKSFLNLPLYTAKYDHVNIGLLSQGHAGFPSPHYHVDIMNVPTSVTDKITCKA